MRLGVLFSGGKDSTLALHIAAEKNEVKCLITMVSKNKESYMFHTPNIGITKLQAESLGIPLITVGTEGQKEEELADLEKAIAKAKDKFQIDGLVTGAIESVYQSSRIQNICSQQGICCLNPLWKYSQKELLETLIRKKFDILISGIFAYPLDERWLGKHLDKEVITQLTKLQIKYGISPSGEGGEIETTVLDCPMFGKRVEVVEFTIDAKNNCGVFTIKQARLAPK